MRCTNKKVLYLDILRAFSIIAVINLHVSVDVVGVLDIRQDKWWWAGNVFDSMSRWAVPVFVMISGVLLLNSEKDTSIKNFIKKRCRRIFVPFVFWSIIYSIWKVRQNLSAFSLKSMIINIDTGPVYYHLWFIYMIFGIYLVTPILKVFVRNAEKNILKYFLVLNFIQVSIFTLLNRFFGVTIGIELPIVTGYSGYFILGYYLDKYELSKKLKTYIYISGVTGMAVTIIGTYLIGISGLKNDWYFYNYLSPNVILVSIAIFVFIKNINMEGFVKENKFRRVITLISDSSFGIYLIHPIIIEVMSSGELGFKITAMFINPIVGILLKDFITLGSCLIIIKFIRKIPYVKYTV